MIESLYTYKTNCLFFTSVSAPPLFFPFTILKTVMINITVFIWRYVICNKLILVLIPLVFRQVEVRVERIGRNVIHCLNMYKFTLIFILTAFYVFSNIIRKLQLSIFHIHPQWLAPFATCQQQVLIFGLNLWNFLVENHYWWWLYGRVGIIKSGVR